MTRVTTLPKKAKRAKAPPISDEIELSECRAVFMGEGGWLLIRKDEYGRAYDIWLEEKEIAQIAHHPYSGIRKLLNMHICPQSPKAA